MVSRVVGLGAFVVLVVGAVSQMAVAAGSGSLGLVRVQDTEAKNPPPCRQVLNRNILSEQGWRFTARVVEVTAEGVSVRLTFYNSRAASGLIALVPEGESRVRLIDKTSDKEFPAETIDGVKAELQKVKRDNSGSATFHFPFPGEARQVTFMSVWIAPIMRGAGQKIEVAFPIALPDRSACGA